jgi:hypothetical protein
VRYGGYDARLTRETGAITWRRLVHGEYLTLVSYSDIQAFANEISFESTVEMKLAHKTMVLLDYRALRPASHSFEGDTGRSEDGSRDVSR